MQPKSKIEWLRQLRRYSTPETVEKMADRIAERLDGNEYGYFQSARSPTGGTGYESVLRPHSASSMALSQVTQG